MEQNAIIMWPSIKNKEDRHFSYNSIGPISAVCLTGWIESAQIHVLKEVKVVKRFSYSKCYKL